MEETTFIYALINPISNEVRYIGKSDTPYKRFTEHLKNYSKEDTHKTRWIDKLLKQGLIPDLLILDEVPLEEWAFWEIHYYELFKSWGTNFINSCYPGYGVTRRTEESLDKSRKGIYQISNKDNSIVNFYKGIDCCIKDLKLRRNRLDELLTGYQVISKGVTKKVKQWKGFIFIKEEDYDSNKDYRVIPRKTKSVIQYSLDNEFIKEYPSIKIASLELGISSVDICASASPNNKQKSAKGYIFKYL